MCLRFQFCTHQRVCILYFLKKSQIRCTLLYSPRYFTEGYLIGSGRSGSRSRRAKMTHKHRNKLINFISLLRIGSGFTWNAGSGFNEFGSTALVLRLGFIYKWLLCGQILWYERLPLRGVRPRVLRPVQGRREACHLHQLGGGRPEGHVRPDGGSAGAGGLLHRRLALHYHGAQAQGAAPRSRWVTRLIESL